MTAGQDWMAAVRPGAVWAFDVDGTLIGSIRSDILRPGAAELLHALAEAGVTCVLWSAGGAEYAAHMAARHGIDRNVAICYGKEHRNHSAKYVIDHFEPEHVPDVFVDDVPLDMPDGSTVLGVPQFLGGNPADSTLLAVVEAIAVRSSAASWPA